MKFLIDDRYHDVRLDRFLRKHLLNTPLTEIFKGIRTGNIKVNGKRAKENQRIFKGDEITIFKSYQLEPNNPSYDKNSFKNLKNNSENFKNKKISLSEKEIDTLKKIIVYEDDNLIIVNKPSGMVMHAGSGHEFGLSEALSQYKNNPDLSFVNRIDKGTSGLVIGAKTLPVARIISQEIREGNIEKKYYILVQGKVKKDIFSIKSNLSKDSDKVVILKDNDPNGKISISHFKKLKIGDRTSLLEGCLETGRTHQLRVQLSSIGHAIVGDKRYNTKIPFKRMMLHSYYLKIPAFSIKIELPIPDDFLPF